MYSENIDFLKRKRGIRFFFKKRVVIYQLQMIQINFA